MDAFRLGDPLSVTNLGKYYAFHELFCYFVNLEHSWARKENNVNRFRWTKSSLHFKIFGWPYLFTSCYCFLTPCIGIKDCLNMRFISSRFVCMHEQMHSELVWNQAFAFSIQCTFCSRKHSLTNVRFRECKSGIDKFALRFWVLTLQSYPSSEFASESRHRFLQQGKPLLFLRTLAPKYLFFACSVSYLGTIIKLCASDFEIFHGPLTLSSILGFYMFPKIWMSATYWFSR